MYTSTLLYLSLVLTLPLHSSSLNTAKTTTKRRLIEATNILAQLPNTGPTLRGDDEEWKRMVMEQAVGRVRGGAQGEARRAEEAEEAEEEEEEEEVRGRGGKLQGFTHTASHTHTQIANPPLLAPSQSSSALSSPVPTILNSLLVFLTKCLLTIFRSTLTLSKTLLRKNAKLSNFMDAVVGGGEKGGGGGEFWKWVDEKYQVKRNYGEEDDEDGKVSKAGTKKK